jgi:Ca2+-binding EF-hand superfamily protein
MLRCFALLILICFSTIVAADEVMVPSFEDNFRKMDKDRNGLVTVAEMRAYLQSKHGKEYRKNILDKLQSMESGASCGTPFSQSFY